MISCKDAVRRLWDYLDGAADPDHNAVEEHLSVCKRCCGEVEFVKELRDFLERNGREAMPQDTRGRLTNFLQQI
jgi:anti-sigma factor (TIGR02949 family)